MLVALSVVLAASTPLSVVNAQSAAQNFSLEQFKQKVTAAIDSSIQKLQDSKENLSVSLNLTVDKNGAVSNVETNKGSASTSIGKDGASSSVSGSDGSSASGSVSKDGASGEVKTSNGGSASANVSKDGVSASIDGAKGGSASISAGNGTLTGGISVPDTLKDKLKAANQKAIDKLEDLKEKVQEASKLEDLKEKAQEFDQAFKEIAIATVQATVTKSIDSMTQVLDRLQVAANNLESQVTKLKECLQSGEFDAEAHVEDGTVSGSFNASAPGCEDLNVAANSGDNAASLQEKLDSAESTMQTIRSFLSSTIALVSELKSGNYTNTMTSFQGIASQVDIVASLSAAIQNDLVNLSTSIKKA